MATVKFYCEEYGCDLPYATLQNGCLMVESKHHGEKHVNIISIWDLVLMVLKQAVKENKDKDETA